MADRSRPRSSKKDAPTGQPTSRITIYLNGRKRSIPSGRSLSSALSEEHIPVLVRSLKYHRPRGQYCGTGQCAGCLVRHNGVPMARACQIVPEDGDVVETESGWPSTEHDLLSLMDRVFSQKMDTLRGFTRPLVLRRPYLKVVRSFSGLGAMPDTAPKKSPSMEQKTVDLLIVGGGATGRAAEQAVIEGSIRQRVHLSDRRVAGESVVYLGPSEDKGFLALVSRKGLPALQVTSRKVLLATGSYDAGLFFPGSDLPGVLTGEGLESLAGEQGVHPFQSIVVFGGGPRTRRLVKRFGSRVKLLAAPTTLSEDLRQLARSLEIEVVERSMILSAQGRNRLRSVLLQDRKTGEQRRVRAGALVLAHRVLPNATLLFQAGAVMQWREGGSAYFPELSPRCETTVPGLFAVGSAAGFLDPTSSLESARCAAETLAGGGQSGKNASSQSSSDPAGLLAKRVPQEGNGFMLEYLTEFLRLPRTRKTVLCPCEDVTLEEVEGVVKEGWDPTLEVVKRLTGTGMGLCQGRYCVPDSILLLSALTGRSPEAIGFMTQRPPVWPLRIGDLAGGR